MNTKIIGAGLAGLIAACTFQDADILESTEKGTPHKALLRFRSDVVSKATGVPFRKVTVHKAIFTEGETYTRATPRLANLYSRKVIGRIGDRSVWNLDPVERWIAPEDFQAQLVEKHARRIQWSTPVGDISVMNSDTIINTAPLPVILTACGLQPIEAMFEHNPIEVLRYRLPKGSDVYQTLYFPQPQTKVFRASITGDLLIIERMPGATSSDLGFVCGAFGIDAHEVIELERVSQKYGKIIDIPRGDRESILHRLSGDYNVFSIGRFACWRNILLDDVVHDIEMVQRLIAASAYDRRIVLAKR